MPDQQPAEPRSPCIKVCEMDWHSGACMGCQRTLEEIAGWSQMSVAEKNLVLVRIQATGAGLTRQS